MGSELVEEPHIARYFVQCFGVVRPDQELLANGGIGKMAEKVGGLLGVIVIATEAQVAILVHIDAEWVPRGNNHPDTNVELPLHDQHGILDVLLDDPGLLRVRRSLARTSITVLWFASLPVVVVSLGCGRCQIGSRMDLLGLPNLRIVQNLEEVFEDSDLSATRKTTRLDYPHIVRAIDVGLGEFLPQFRYQGLANLVDILPHLSFL